MFGRRKRSSSHHHQPLSTSASQSAQSAASQAFLRSQPSSGSLSSAAAATALRSLTPTPTPVENVQTKRMVQRRSSTQSPPQTSQATARRSASVSGPLRRSSSQSSMSTRSFREPSPHGPVISSRSANHPEPLDVPPLPSLPQQYSSRQPANRRCASMEPATRSTPGSPGSPRTKKTRGVSADGDRDMRAAAAAAHSYNHKRFSSLGSVPELERSASRNSVNFSYPMGARPNSPTGPPQNRSMTLKEAVHELPSTEVSSIQQSVTRASEKPVKTKPRTHAPEGSHLAHRSAGGPPVGTAVAAAQAVIAPKGSSHADTGDRRQGRVEDDSVVPGLTGDYGEDELPASISSPETSHPSSRAAHAQWPTTVPEENGPAEIADTDVHNTQGRGSRLTSASPTIDHVEAVTPNQASPSSEQGARQHQHLRESSSPGRSTRFAKWLSVSAAGEQVHEPPPRSISPGKSAMKHPRGNSLSPDRKTGILANEISDGTSVASDEGPRIGAKKRSVKVSFDDEAEIVGVAASPPTSPEELTPDSPTGKSKSRMSWFGIGKKKPSSPLEYGSRNDFDQVMKPRPALPSFGSVRGKREAGLQASSIPEFSDNESSDSSEGVEGPGVSFSNDHVLGGVLHNHQHQAAHQLHGTNILEQMSVGEASTASQATISPDVKPAGVAIAGIAEQQPYAGLESETPVPSIAVQPATPQVEVEEPRPSMDRSSMEGYRIPGGFPPSSSDNSLKSAAASTTPAVASAVPKLDDVEDTEGESGDSVYSDAAEDFDGDGFGSINAIVDSRPIPRSSVPLDSRDTTPKPINRTTPVDSGSDDIPDEAAEDARAATPTQDSVSRQIWVMPSQSESPPLPSESQARAPTVQNGTVQSESKKQKRPMSVDTGVQNPRWSSNASSPGSAKSKSRPISLGPAFQPGFPPSLGRTMSNGSDSSSSFVRASPPSRRDGSHAIQTTLRSGGGRAQRRSPSEQPDSPREYRPTSSGSATATMRKTLRNPSSGGEQRFSFFSTNNKSPRATVTKKSPKSKASRFVESDDEDSDARPQFFRSRFANSSDEDEPNNTLRPVRGIPRRKDERDGDSTELEDSSEEDRRQARRLTMAAPPSGPTPPGSRGQNAPGSMSGLAAVARQRGMTQRELEEFLMQPPGGRKPGLLKRLGFKKSKNPDHRIRKADVESPSRRDTPLERSRLEREQLRNDSVVNGSRGHTITTVSSNHDQPASSPKLLKRGSKRAGIPWPLHSNADEQPSNSTPSSPQQPSQPAPSTQNGGHNGTAMVNDAPDSSTKEPALPRMSSPGADTNDGSSIAATEEDHGPSARDVVISGSGRKKRFPLLRKALRLKA
ncbi:hypothetical protein N7510_003346 [Penicillium lagena]|uniref:uncharacterized protein n=1 Tax=Penicillium lagena TaxID=94218 RepID=UPI002540CFAB|nr:uncharacterized protein N7510_003346 [Penicillium lagena]KAJ5619362.1 hypothetical protein N7510_003346 [Penicillium lagena]